MDEDLYDHTPSTQERTNPEHEDREDKGDGKTVLVNDSICPGLKPGDGLNLRVVETQEKQYVCEYDKEGKEEKGGEPPAKMPMGGGEGGSDDMYS